MRDKYNVVVVGGGLAGVSAAIATARLGCKVALVQDRPVLGGNSSSEIRVSIGGACDYNPWARETGILEELFAEDRVQNPAPAKGTGHVSPIWDLILYEAVREEENIELFLDTCAREVKLNGVNKERIKEIECYQTGTEKKLSLRADLFIDATGDATIAYRAGAETRMGRESAQEFGETLAPIKADNATQGSSLAFHTCDVGHPIAFEPPQWVPEFTRDEDLPFRSHKDIRAGYWWIEVGCPPYNTIIDNDKIRHELIKQLLGVWNHIKNHGDHGAENLMLDWIGMVPGKRESRRIMGDYVLCEKDLKENREFPDRVAYAGWYIDLHTPGGILVKNKPPEPTFNVNLKEIDRRRVYIYSIPFRCLYSKNIENLMMAGRDISVTHVALGSTRLMATCATIGQAVGTAAYLCEKYKILPREIYDKHINELQQLLLKQDCYIPSVGNQDPEDLTRRVKITASSSAKLRFEEGQLGLKYVDPLHKYISLSNLQTERVQLFPVSSNHVDCINLLLESQYCSPAQVELSLYKAKTIWDLSSSQKIKTVRSNVPPQSISWIKFPIEMSVTPHKLYWISVRAKDKVFWRYSEKAPVGTASASRIINRWAFNKGAYSMHLFPESTPYEPENILSGVTRPEKWANIWISDPCSSFPQYVELDFGKEVTFNTVYLIFDTNLNRTHKATPPLFRAPECVKDYALFDEQKESWKLLLKVKGNYQRRRIHHFNSLTSRKLRLEIYSTNGYRSARVYEIRVYRESNLGI